jgi:acetolactate synthase-1/2/3 large subunit
VICFTGDGSLLMNIQELATAAEHDVNLKVVGEAAERSLWLLLQAKCSIDQI